MATYIYVNNQDVELLQRNRAEAERNRRRLAQRLWLQGLNRAKKAKEKKPRQDAHRRRVGPSEEPANPRIRIPKLLHLRIAPFSSGYTMSTVNLIKYTTRLVNRPGGVVDEYMQNYTQANPGATLFSGGSFGFTIRPSDVEIPAQPTIVKSSPPVPPSYGNDGWSCSAGFYSRNVNYRYSDAGESNVIVIPAGGQTAIVVVMLRYDWDVVNLRMSGPREGCVAPQAPVTPPTAPTGIDGYSVDSVVGSADAGVSNRAYFCTPRSIREIQIPAAMQAIVDVYNPPYNTVTRSIDQTQLKEGGWTYSYSGRLPSVTPTLLPDEYYTGFGFDGTYVRNRWTPAVFSVLNEVAPFVSSSAIKTFPETKFWVMPDVDRGWYLEALDRTEGVFDSNQLFYGEWGIPNEEPGSATISRRRDDMTYTALPGSDFLSSIAPGPVPTVATSQLTVVWDWDDAMYCRQMCKALGFSVQDLAP